MRRGKARFRSWEADSNFWIRVLSLCTLVQLMPMAKGRAVFRSFELCQPGQLAFHVTTDNVECAGTE